MEYINLVLSCIAFLLIIFLSLRIFSWIKKYFYITKFQSYASVLMYHMEKAYDIIHKEHILIYSLEATRPDIDNVDKANKEFCKLTIKMLGPMLFKEMINVYGNVDTVLFIMAEYFNDQYEGDEIRSASINNLTEKENETDKAIGAT